MSLMEFTDTTMPDISPDSIPPTIDVEYPCQVCGREAGPYSGRGRKPTKCQDCKPKRSTSGVRLTGNAQNLAVQATQTLVQINAMISMVSAAMGYFKTGGAIIEYNETFEQQAFAALSTDPELCRAIVRTGAKSAKLSLGMAYAGIGMAIGPTLYTEAKAKKEERRVRMEEAENAAGFAHT